MNSLARLQRDFQRYVYRRTPRFLARVAQSVDRRGRAEIYWRAYRARLVEALEENYPGLRALAGKRLFARLASAFVESHPSRHANLRWYGGELPAFLRRHRAGRNRPWLAEVAAFDWALGLAFDAADAAAVSAKDLAAIAPERWAALRFAAHPSLQRLDLRYNVGAIRKAADAGKSAPKPRRSERRVAWIIWRQGLATYFRSLEPPQARALDAVRAGKTFGQVCKTLSSDLPRTDAPRAAAGYLRAWIGDGLISAVQKPRSKEPSLCDTTTQGRARRVHVPGGSARSL